MSLKHQDVQELLKLLDDSPYDELSLQTGAFTLHLRRSDDGKRWQQHHSLARNETLPLHEVRPALASDTASQETQADSGLLAVPAPMVGTWYRAPQPGAESFIQPGRRVEPDTVIGIIEVMKLMSSIPAGVRGTVVDILVDDATLVEKGQCLLHVRPD